MKTQLPACNAYFATRPGRTALDRDTLGGNPFASALVEALRSDSLLLSDLGNELDRLTRAYSKGVQEPEAPDNPSPPGWALRPAKDEKRVALVIVNSEYDRVTSLPGAKFDADRISGALAGAGFETIVTVDPADPSARLRSFRELSADADVSLVYSTGHGVEAGGETYLLDRTFSSKHERAKWVPLSALADAGSARHVRLLFFGACRTRI